MEAFQQRGKGQIETIPRSNLRIQSNMVKSRPCFKRPVFHAKQTKN